MRRPGALALAALAVSGATGCGVLSPRVPHDCHLGDDASPASSARPAAPVDLSSLKLYRNTYAVERVGPYAQHFTLWFHDIEPAYEQVRARVDPATGRVHIEVDHGMWGGIGDPPARPREAPPELRELERALAREAEARCPDARGWVVAYDGAYREIDLVEMIAVTPKEKGNTRVGWNARATLAADDALTRLLPIVPEAMSGYGLLETHEPIAWLDVAPVRSSEGSALLVDRLMRNKGQVAGTADADLVEQALSAAKRLRDGAPSPSLASIVERQGVTLLPEDLHQRLRVKVTFYARARAPGAPYADLPLAVPLETNALVHGATEGESSGVVGGIHVKVRAKLTPRAPRAADATGTTTAPFEADLAVHIEDDRGHVFERVYPARGTMITEGAVAAAPSGLVLPGTSGPSKEMDDLHGAFPSPAPYAGLDFYLDASVLDDPREP